MRWKKYPLKEHYREQRVVEKFLILPRCINNEWRWLEQATIKQEVFYDVDSSYYWRDTDWVDEEKGKDDVEI